MSSLRPFWRYYGGKWRAAPRYPAPIHETIVEPFAGAAGYSLRYPERQIVLVEKYTVIAAVWRWLIGVSSDEVLAIPEVFNLDDLPEWVPQPARWLVGFQLAEGAGAPRQYMSPVARRNRGQRAERPNSAQHARGWSPAMRQRIAAQVTKIRHWQVIEGDYTAAPDVKATWFVDPPYEQAGRSVYVHSSRDLDFASLAAWVRRRRGQAIACEAEGATWLPFRAFGAARSTAMNSRVSREAIWTGGVG